MGACRFGPDVSVCVVEERKFSNTTKCTEKSLEDTIFFGFINI